MIFKTNSPLKIFNMKNSKLTALIVLPMLIFFVTSCQKEVEKKQTPVSPEEATISTGSRTNIPDEIRFTQPGLYPEGVAFDKFNNRFLVSSFGRGTIGAVSFDGNYTPLIEDPDLKSTLGLHIDEARKRIVAAVTDGLLGDVAKVGVYDLNTGSRIWLIDLAAIYPGGIHLADDLTIDPQGNIYITDTKSPVIYKVDMNGNASVFFEDQYFAKPPWVAARVWSGFNGIAYDNDGFLIVAYYAGSAVGKPSLVKIPINDQQHFSAVAFDFPATVPDFSLDGILLSRNGKELIGANNKYLSRPMEIVHLTSNDHWASAKRIETFPTGFTSPTTATSDGKDIFVMYSFLYDIFFGTPFTNSTFIIKKIPFEKLSSF
jgi:sugar lactone lactonase YvrE